MARGAGNVVLLGSDLSSPLLFSSRWILTT